MICSENWFPLFRIMHQIMDLRHPAACAMASLHNPTASPASLPSQGDGKNGPVYMIKACARHFDS
jgi:hypothetical protein